MKRFIYSAITVAMLLMCNNIANAQVGQRFVQKRVCDGQTCRMVLVPLDEATEVVVSKATAMVSKQRSTYRPILRRPMFRFFH